MLASATALGEYPPLGGYAGVDGGEVGVGVDEAGVGAAVECHKGVGSDLGIAAARAKIGGDDVCALQYHIRLDRHTLRLQRREVILRVDKAAERVVGAAHAVLRVADLFGEHHAPREAVAFIVPAHIAGVGEVTQRQDDLGQRE